jgi:nicotinate-nucleotide adenylyltransferase
MSELRRIGLFGGAFDPPHLAHVALARAAQSQLGLDRLILMPTGQAWHKARPLTEAAHRLAMARLAFGEVPGAIVDARETQRAGATYTIDTLRELGTEYPDARWFLLIGADQARAFDTWREADEIARLATICVARRSEDSLAASPRLADAQPAVYPIPEGRWTVLTMPSMPLSATLIRQRLAQGESIADLVPPAVARYIDHHHLYAPT